MNNRPSTLNRGGLLNALAGIITTARMFSLIRRDDDFSAGYEAGHNDAIKSVILAAGGNLEDFGYSIRDRLSPPR